MKRMNKTRKTWYILTYWYNETIFYTFTVGTLYGRWYLYSINISQTLSL